MARLTQQDIFRYLYYAIEDEKLGAGKQSVNGLYDTYKALEIAEKPKVTWKAVRAFVKKQNVHMLYQKTSSKFLRNRFISYSPYIKQSIDLGWCFTWSHILLNIAKVYICISSTFQHLCQVLASRGPQTRAMPALCAVWIFSHGMYALIHSKQNQPMKYYWLWKNLSATLKASQAEKSTSYVVIGKVQ